VSGADADREQVERLLEHHLPRLTGFVRLRTGALLRSMESAEDLVQSVCREVLEQGHRFRYDGEEGFRRCLFTAAARKISDRLEYYRAQKRDPGRRVPLEPDTAASVSSELLECYRSFCTPSRGMREQEEVARIEAAFEELPDAQREVIALSRMAGLSHQEIAQQTGRSEGSVRMLLYRGLERLSELLADPI
jgi:RNA polymerase sigma-70 factor (ECF subfamily)